MKLNFFTILFVLCTTMSFAQMGTILSTPRELDSNPKRVIRAGRLFMDTFDGRYAGTVGSPYLFEEYFKANILLETKEFFQNLDIKYNVFENNFLYINSDSTTFLVEAQYVNYIELYHETLNKPIRLAKLEGISVLDPKMVLRFFVILYNGNKIKFASLPGKEFIKADFQGSGYSSTRTYDEFVNKKSYYIKRTNGSIDKINLNKKNLLNSLADKVSEIKTFINNEKVDASTEEGWVKVLAYYEKL
jgi:hypothetical protein